MTFIEQSFPNQQHSPFQVIRPDKNVCWNLKNLRLNPLSANPTEWSNTLKQFVGIADELFKCVWPFCGIGALRVKYWVKYTHPFKVQDTSKSFYVRQTQVKQFQQQQVFASIMKGIYLQKLLKLFEETFSIRHQSLSMEVLSLAARRGGLWANIIKATDFNDFAWPQIKWI